MMIQARITLIVGVCMLVAILALGWLLKGSYEAQGALESRVEQLREDLRASQEDISRLQSSQQVTDDVLNRSKKERDKISKSTRDIQDKLEGVLNEQNSSGGAPYDATELVRLLNLASCEAEKGSGACDTPASPSK